jgi:hypothetical protein
MAGPTLVRIKRSQGAGATATPGALANGELAYTSNGDVLFVGIEDGVVPIGGERVPGTKTANQALVVNSTGMIDRVDFGNSTVNTFANSLGFHLANSTVSISLIKPTTAEQAGSYYLKADGSWSTVTGATADPAGSDTHIQYNDSDVMGGSAGFTYIDTTNTVHIGNSTVNTVANSTVVRISNSTVTMDYSKPTAAEVSSADYYLASDSSWKQVSADLGGLTDVTLSSESNNQLLVYDEAAGMWENHTAGDGIVFTAHDFAVEGANGVTVTAAGVNVDAEDGLDGGLSVNSTGVWADAANGIIITAAGLNVNVGTNGGLVSNTTGVWIDANNGVTTDADGLKAVVGDTMTLNTTGIHVNSDLTITDLTLSGNLTVQGTLTTIDTTNLIVEDPLIWLAKEQANSGSFTDTADVGFVGSYGNTVQTHYAGVFRDTSESDNRFKIFDSTDDFPAPTTTVDTANVNFALANLEINALFLGVGLAGTEGGTGRTTNVDQDLLVANSTNGYDLLTAGANGEVLQVVDGVLAYDGIDGGTF